MVDIKSPMVLDGGLSNELENQGCSLLDSLWSAEILQSNPNAIVASHLAYLEAGAQCIITASYQASVEGFKAKGYSKPEAEEVIRKSILLAEEAIRLFMVSHREASKPLIAASIGPYGAYLADGSEYHGDYGVDDSLLTDFHKKRIALIDSTNADFMACETIPSLQEALVLSDIISETTKSTWISFSCKDHQHLNDGTPVANCIVPLAKNPQIFAIGVNCTSPKFISGLITEIRSAGWGKKVVVYPNSGEAYNAKTKSWMGVSEPLLFAEMASEWIDLGADIIGGCCRIGPEHIKSLKENINL